MSVLVLSINRGEEECVHGSAAVDKNFAAALFGSQDLHILEADWALSCTGMGQCPLQDCAFTSNGPGFERERPTRMEPTYTFDFSFFPPFFLTNLDGHEKSHHQDHHRLTQWLV